MKDGHVSEWVVATSVGSGGYEGLVLHVKYTREGDEGPLLAAGYIVEAKGGPAERPLQVTSSRVDRLELHPGMILFPQSDPPQFGMIGKIEIMSGVTQSSHAGRCTEMGVGLMNPITGTISAMGTCTAANGDLLYWVAMGTTDLATGIFNGAIHFAGGTGRFDAAVGGFDGRFAEDIQNTDNPLVKLATFGYSVKGTIRY